MKESPQTKHLEEILRSSKIVAGGFMGTDTRGIFEIIDIDSATVAKSGFTITQIAARMREITKQATPLLGNWTKYQTLLVKVDEAKGTLPCPWPHPKKFAKRLTHVKSADPQATSHESQVIKWSDLNIHLIESHGFFEGKGSAYRIEPDKLIKIIF
jgi:hypothetical protein